MIPSSGQNELVQVGQFQDPLALPELRLDRGSLALHLIRLLVLTQPLVHRRPQPAVVRPLGESISATSSGSTQTTSPLRTFGIFGTSAKGDVSRRSGFSLASSRVDLGLVEAGADVPGPAQDAVLVDAEDERAERSRPAALPFRVARDHELLPAAAS